MMGGVRVARVRIENGEVRRWKSREAEVTQLVTGHCGRCLQELKRGRWNSNGKDSMAAVIGGLALLSNSVAQMNYGGIALHVFTIFFYLILLFRNFSTRKIHFLLPLVATLACSIGFSLNYLNHKGLVSLAIWKAWNHLISFGCLYVLTQVIFSRLSPSMERNKLVGFLISALISFLPNVSAKWSWPSSRRKMAMEAATAPTWTADLLFSCQTFFHVLRNPRDPKALAVFISSARSLVKEMIRMWGPYLAA